MNRREFFKTSILPASILLPVSFSALAIEGGRKTVRVEGFLKDQFFKEELFLVLGKDSIVKNCHFSGNVKIFYKDLATVTTCIFSDGLNIRHNGKFSFVSNLIENMQEDSYLVKINPGDQYRFDDTIVRFKENKSNAVLFKEIV